MTERRGQKGRKNVRASEKRREKREKEEEEAKKLLWLEVGYGGYGGPQGLYRQFWLENNTTGVNITGTTGVTNTLFLRQEHNYGPVFSSRRFLPDHVCAELHFPAPCSCPSLIKSPGLFWTSRHEKMPNLKIRMGIPFGCKVRSWPLRRIL